MLNLTSITIPDLSTIPESPLPLSTLLATARQQLGGMINAGELPDDLQYEMRKLELFLHAASGAAIDLENEIRAKIRRDATRWSWRAVQRRWKRNIQKVKQG